MVIGDFLNFLLDDAMEDARVRSMSSPGDRMEFEGASLALEECRRCLDGDRMAIRMEMLLHEARTASAEAQSAGWPDTAFWFAREVQVEWIADVVSVILLHCRMPTIMPPTRGAAIAAAKLAGSGDDT